MIRYICSTDCLCPHILDHVYKITRSVPAFCCRKSLNTQAQLITSGLTSSSSSHFYTISVIMLDTVPRNPHSVIEMELTFMCRTVYYYWNIRTRMTGVLYDRDCLHNQSLNDRQKAALPQFAQLLKETTRLGPSHPYYSCSYASGRIVAVPVPV